MYKNTNQDETTENLIESETTFYQRTKGYLNNIYGKIYTKIWKKPYPYSKKSVLIPLYQTQYESYFNKDNNISSSYKEFSRNKEHEIFEKHTQNLDESDINLESDINHLTHNMNLQSDINHMVRNINLESDINNSSLYNRTSNNNVNNLASFIDKQYFHNYKTTYNNKFDSVILEAPTDSSILDSDNFITDIFNDVIPNSPATNNIYNVQNSSLLFNPDFISNYIQNTPPPFSINNSELPFSTNDNNNNILSSSIDTIQTENSSSSEPSSVNYNLKVQELDTNITLQINNQVNHQTTAQYQCIPDDVSDDIPDDVSDQNSDNINDLLNNSKFQKHDINKLSQSLYDKFNKNTSTRLNSSYDDEIQKNPYI